MPATLMKNILHICLDAGQPPYYPIRNAFKKHFKVYNELSWQKMFNNSGLEKTRQAIRQIVIQNNFDCIFMQIQRPGIITPDLANFMAKKSFVVNWTGDVRNDITWYKQVGQKIQLTLFTNTNDVLQCRKHGVNADFLQVGFDNNIFYPDKKINPEDKITFCANNYKGSECNFPLSDYRVNVVNHLNQKYNSRFTVYGKNWQTCGIQTSYILPQKEALLYRGSAINLSISNYCRQNYFSDRLLRIMASGGFALSHYYPGIEKDFTPGVHLDYFKNIAQLDAKIDYYLKNHQKRKQIAATGCQYVHKTYSWDAFVAGLKTLIEKYN